MAIKRITTNLIKDSDIATVDIANNAITAAKITDGNITTAKLADLSVTAGKLAGTLDLTGKTITVATATTGDNDTSPASTAFVQQEIAALVDSSPDSLNTLNELAAALGDDASFSTTVTNSIATKLPLAGGTLTGALTVSATTATINITGGSSGASLINFGDSDDGNVGRIYYDHTNNFMQFKAGDAERMRIDSAGRVGLGTSSPSSYQANADDLVVATSGHTGITIASGTTHLGNIHFADGTTGDDAYRGFIQYEHTANYMRFATNATEAMRIDSSGNVKFGATGDGYISGTAPNTYNSGYSQDNDSWATWMNYNGYQDGTSRYRDFIVGNGKQGRIATFDGSSGNVGIGTNNPTGGKLHVVGDVFAESGSFYVGSGGVVASDSTSRDLNFAIGNTTPKMTLDTSGNVGIGATSPTSVSGYTVLDLTGSNGGIYETSNGTQTARLYTTTTQGYVGTSSNHNFTILTNEQERATFDTSGNLLVGTSTLTPNYNGGIRVHSASSVGNIRVSAGAKTGFDMMADSGGTGYLVVRDDAGMTFHTNNTERMNISSSGQVRLQVDGGNAEIEALRICSIDPDMPNYQYNHAVALGFELAAYDGGDRTSKLTAKIVGRKGADGGNDWYTGGASTNFQGQLDFYTRNDDVLTKHMDLDEHGDLTLGGSTAGSNVLTVGRTGTSNQGAAILNLKSQNESIVNFYDVGTNTMRLFSYSVNARWKDVPNSDDCIQFEAAGNIDIDGAYLTGGFDYAEYFESTDGTAIPVGTTVVLVNEKVRAATSGEQPIGVVRPGSSGTSVVGGAAGLRWAGKYLKDDYDAYLYDTVDYWTWKDVGDTNNTGNEDQQCWSDRVPEGWVVPSDKTVTSRQRKRLNPDFVENLDADGNQIYVNRESRDEWNCIGLLGQVPITKGQVTNSNWTKLKDRSASVELWFIK